MPPTYADRNVSLLTRRVLTAVAVLALALPICMPEAFGDKKADKKALLAAKNQFNRALKEIKNPKTRDVGIGRLRGLAEQQSGNVVGKKAQEMLLEYGVGTEVQVILDDRKRFKKLFQVKDQEVLESAEKSLEELRQYYAVVKLPAFKKSNVTLRFYDSRSRYRKVTGLITVAGVFKVLKADQKTGTIEGEIQWYFPQGTSVRNRDFRLNSLLYHELSHYLNSIAFGAHMLPSAFEEGLAVYMETRAYVEPDQGKRTIRDYREAAARNGLGTIKKYSDFIKLLNSERGFGRGDSSIGRWYGNVYGVMDYLINGELDGKTASIKEFLLDLSKRSEGVLQGKSKRPSGEELLEAQVKELLGTDLKTFHGGLLKHVQKYRQI
jgi:hypothetical protein